VTGRFYINRLATYPRFRNRGIGSTLLEQSDSLVLAAEFGLVTLAVPETDGYTFTTDLNGPTHAR